MQGEHLTREKFNTLKKYYDETWDETSHTLHVGLFRRAGDSLERSYVQATEYLVENAAKILPITKDSTVLDVGCGAGRTIITICEQFGCSGVGVDLSDEQIRDANAYLAKVQRERIVKGLPKLRVRFVRASGSDLAEEFPKDGQFTHVVSQDALLFVTNKRSLYENIERLLVPGGVFAVADFLSEPAETTYSKQEHRLIYQLVNWNAALSFAAYREILSTVGLRIMHAEERGPDMIRTYEKLARRMKKYAKRGDATYADLLARYEHIVQAVQSGKMGWGLFFAQKPSRPVAVLAGSKRKSIGRFLAKQLHAAGYEIWLYGRHVKRLDTPFWHERSCDVSDASSIAKLLSELPRVDLVMMLADTGSAHADLETLSAEEVTGFMQAKLLGSTLFVRALLQQFSKRDAQLPIVWCGGKLTQKPKHLMLYGLVNSGLAAFVDELNAHYPETLRAYYLPTALISPSTIGDAYIRAMGPETRKLAQHPQYLADTLKRILAGSVAPGMISLEQKTL